jgi:hypothetical protein
VASATTVVPEGSVSILVVSGVVALISWWLLKSGRVSASVDSNDSTLFMCMHKNKLGSSVIVEPCSRDSEY